MLEFYYLISVFHTLQLRPWLPGPQLFHVNTQAESSVSQQGQMQCNIATAMCNTSNYGNLQIMAVFIYFHCNNLFTAISNKLWKCAPWPLRRSQYASHFLLQFLLSLQFDPKQKCQRAIILGSLLLGKSRLPEDLHDDFLWIDGHTVNVNLQPSELFKAGVPTGLISLLA